MTLTINLATRNRAELLADTVRITLDNIRRSDTCLIVSVDDDDPASAEVVNKIADPRLLWSLQPREDTLGEKYNRALKLRPADVYLPMVDHSPQRTRGFDQVVLDAAARYPDGICAVYGPLANASFPTLQAVSAGLADAMGYIWPPYFPYWFGDHWIDDMAKLIDRVAFVDVHVDCSKRPGTMERREAFWWATFYDCGRLVRRQCAADIIRSPKFIATPGEKANLLAHYPLVEFRSRWINDTVRQSLGAEAGPLPDERYLRVKANAKAVLRSWLPGLEADAKLAA